MVSALIPAIQHSCWIETIFSVSPGGASFRTICSSDPCLALGAGGSRFLSQPNLPKLPVHLTDRVRKCLQHGKAAMTRPSGSGMSLRERIAYLPCDCHAKSAIAPQKDRNILPRGRTANKRSVTVFPSDLAASIYLHGDAAHNRRGDVRRIEVRANDCSDRSDLFAKTALRKFRIHLLNSSDHRPLPGQALSSKIGLHNCTNKNLRVSAKNPECPAAFGAPPTGQLTASPSMKDGSRLDAGLKVGASERHGRANYN